MRDVFHKIFRLIYPHKDSALVKKEYRLPNSLSLNFHLTPDGWFVVTSPELPGLVTQARDHQELIVMINDAVLTYFDVPRKDADIIYDKVTYGNQEIHYKAKLQTQLN